MRNYADNRDHLPEHRLITIVCHCATSHILTVLHGLLVLELVVIRQMLPHVYCSSENTTLGTLRINGHPSLNMQFSLKFTGLRDQCPCFAAKLPFVRMWNFVIGKGDFKTLWRIRWIYQYSRSEKDVACSIAQCTELPAALFCLFEAYQRFVYEIQVLMIYTEKCIYGLKVTFKMDFIVLQHK